jgi:hypothetical protein
VPIKKKNILEKKSFEKKLKKTAYKKKDHERLREKDKAPRLLAPAMHAAWGAHGAACRQRDQCG